MKISVQQLATYLQGELHGDRNIEVSGVAPATQAARGDVTFAEDHARLRQAVTSGASAIITFADAANLDGPAQSEARAAYLRGKALICVANPRAAFARTLALFFPPRAYEAGVHPTAVIGRGAQLGDGVHIGPYVVVGDDVRIGARSVLEAAVTIGEGAVLGEDCVLYPRVTIYPRVVLGNRVMIHAGAVIGSDGFGYVPEGGRHLKIPQVGNVVIEDDVEIGANTTIDRATLGSTVVKRGTKIDNLVMVAHNNTVGEHCLLAAQVGLAGSVTLGNHVMLGGQVGVADHLSIGDQVAVGAQGGVIGDIPARSVVWGTPAQPHREWLRQLAALRRLPDVIKTLSQKGIIGASPPPKKRRT